MKRLSAFLFASICFCGIAFFFVSFAYAVSVHIRHSPSVVSFDQFVVDVAISGATPGTNYLRIDLYKDGTTNYFGETFNGIDWYSGSDGTQYYPVVIADDKTGSASCQARIGQTLSKTYDGTGIYKVKVRRYTSASGYTFSDPVDIALAVPTFTNTPMTILTSTNTPSPTETKKPTPTPTRTPTPSCTPSPKPLSMYGTPTIAPTTLAHSAYEQTSSINEASDEATVLAFATKSSDLFISPATPQPTESVHAPADSILLQGGFFIVGFCMFLSGILLFWRQGYDRNKG